MTTKEEFATRRKTWLDALRSGKYKQGTTYLKVDDCYCCLGVACELTGYPSEEELGYTSWEELGGNNRLISTMSKNIMNYYGFAFADGLFKNAYTYKDHNSLANLNDTERMTFNEIADFVEKNMSKVFIDTEE